MSTSARTLVNDSQRIAVVCQDKRNADGSYYLENGHRVAENVAYAWNADGTVGERVVSKKVRFIDVDGQQKELTKWLSASEIAPAQQGASVRIWENGEWKTVTFVLLP
jgi:hypothetical protein